MWMVVRSTVQWRQIIMGLIEISSSLQEKCEAKLRCHVSWKAGDRGTLGLGVFVASD
jgi:hypothetical protein